jgi:hypothetical protein
LCLRFLFDLVVCCLLLCIHCHCPVVVVHLLCACSALALLFALCTRFRSQPWTSYVIDFPMLLFCCFNDLLDSSLRSSILKGARRLPLADCKLLWGIIFIHIWGLVALPSRLEWSWSFFPVVGAPDCGLHRQVAICGRPSRCWI